MLLINIFIQVVLAYIASGKTCDKNDAEGSWECVEPSNCTTAIKLIREDEVQKVCGSTSSKPLVCCYKEIDTSFPPGCKGIWRKNREPPIIPLIVGGGGIDSLAREFPHMAALGFDDEDNSTIWGCGGILITREYVLTAAHCLRNRNMGLVKYVRLGDLNLHSIRDDADPQNFTVVERIRHPDYRPPSAYHDLGIIKLDKPCKITPYVIPACLNTKKDLPSGQYSATGWGQLGYGGELADHLQNMIINIFNHTQCQKAYSTISKRRLSKGIDEETQLCAGDFKIDTCPGDSGGPLQLRKKEDNTVYGVTSFGVACVISKIPGVYIKVAPYIPWIKSIILS